MFFKGIKNATPVNTQMTWKQNSTIADMESFSGLDRSNQPQHPLQSKPNLKMAPTSLHFHETEGGKEAAE